MPIDLDELERLERAATQWPWAGGNAFDIFTDDDAARRGEPGTHIAHTDPSDDKEFDKGRADRDLIVALRNAAPALFAELRTLRARVDELERDARLGAVVRAEVSNANTYGPVPTLDLDVRAAGARARGDYAIGYLLSAIADAIRAEEGGEHG